MRKPYTWMQKFFSAIPILVCIVSPSWGQENSPQGRSEEASSGFIEEQHVEPFYLVADWSLVDESVTEPQPDLNGLTASCSDLLYQNQIP